MDQSMAHENDVLSNFSNFDFDVAIEDAGQN